MIQASTAFWPGYPERTEIHGTKGTAIISGDKLTTWDVENDSGDPAPVAQGRRVRRIRPDGDFARAVRAPVPRLRRSDHERAASRWWPARRVIEALEMWTRSTDRAARGSRSVWAGDPPNHGRLHQRSNSRTVRSKSFIR